MVEMRVVVHHIDKVTHHSIGRSQAVKTGKNLPQQVRRDVLERIVRRDQVKMLRGQPGLPYISNPDVHAQAVQGLNKRHVVESTTNLVEQIKTGAVKPRGQRPAPCLIEQIATSAPSQLRLQQRDGINCGDLPGTAHGQRKRHDRHTPRAEFKDFEGDAARAATDTEKVLQVPLGSVQLKVEERWPKLTPPALQPPIAVSPARDYRK